MVLAACGTDDADTSTAPDVDPPATDAPEPEPDNGMADWPETLVLTLQPAEDASALIDDADTLAGFLTERLGVEVTATVPTDYAGVIVALGAGQADIGGGFGPVNVARAMDQVGAEPILQSERFGEFLYTAQWFTNDPDTFCEDDPVPGVSPTLERIQEEAGEEYTLLFCNGVDPTALSEEGPFGLDSLQHVGDARISFVSEGSASGQVFPSYGLISAGYNLADLDTFFAGGHPESVLAVYNGDADVGVSFNDARET
ncbi:hypothetical protein BH23ACT5_BH23ACT5_18770 [soil metagenome]